MPYPTAILFTAALLTTALVAVGWWMDPAAPGIGQWFATKATEGGLWTGLMLFLACVGVVAWRRRRSGAGPG